MSSGRGTPGRRLRLVPGLRHPAEEAPRVEALDALLREVDGLRLTLETDLTMAASAVESGSPQLAAEILDSDRSALRRFEERALDQLALLEAQDELPRQHRSLWSQAHAGPVVAAAALVGLLVGVVPQVLGTASSAPPSTTVAASDSLERLQQLAAHGDPDQVRAASLALHEQLANVVANAKADPAAAQTALLLLSYEQSAIVRSGDSTALADVLQQSRALARAIVAALPHAVESAVPSVAPEVVRPEPRRSPRAEAHPAATGSPRPSSAASPHPSASPSPSKSDDYPLPSNPLAP